VDCELFTELKMNRIRYP